MTKPNLEKRTKDAETAHFIETAGEIIISGSMAIMLLFGYVGIKEREYMQSTPKQEQEARQTKDMHNYLKMCAYCGR